jgi:hypothetical protein
MTAEVVICLLLALMEFRSLTRLRAQEPVLTTISDTVYRADRTPVSGRALISRPSFVAAEGNAVTAGNVVVTLGPHGAFTA